MNGIDKITARLSEEAEAAASAILAEADAKCAEIKAGYLKRGEAQKAALKDEADRARESDAERLESSLLMMEKKEMLALKQEMVEEAFRQAREKLLSLSEEDYTAFLARSAAAAAEHGLGSIVLNPEDRKKYGSKVLSDANQLLREKGVKGELTLDDETREIEAGVILKNGAVEVNCSVDTLLALTRKELASEVASILFS